MASDGQVTLGETVMKQTARKLRRLHLDAVLVGFAGSSADAFTLFERFEARLEEHSGNLARAVIELAKDWRTDRVLRRLEAMLAARCLLEYTTLPAEKIARAAIEAAAAVCVYTNREITIEKIV